MKEKNQINHDISNYLERLRIMQGLVVQENFEDVSKEELKADLEETLQKLKLCFNELLQY